MKYSEFEAEVEKFGFFVDMDNAPLYVDKAKGGETLIAIGKHKRFSVDPGWSGFHNLSENEQLAIYNLAHALAITPPAEREEEKLYNVVLPLVGSSTRYMQRGEYRDGILILDNSGYDFVKSNPKLYAFTEQEIKDTDERYLAFKVEVSE